MCERLTQPVKQFRESLVGNNLEHLQPGFGLWAKFSYSHPDGKVKFFVIPSPTFTAGKIFESLKCIYYSPCAMVVLTVFMWNVSIIPKLWGFYWWLERNRLHCPELKSNEWHKVKINWRHLKKGKKKKTQRNLSFFSFPLTCSQLISPHILIIFSLHGVCGGDNWFMCSFAYPPVPAAECRMGSPALAANTALANQGGCQKQLSINGVCGNNQELFESARW